MRPMWSRTPVRSASCRTRATSTVSASGGDSGSPSRLLTGPGWAAPAPAQSGCRQRSSTAAPQVSAYCMACSSRRRLCGAGAPPELRAAAPASSRERMGASCAPSGSRVSAPSGRHRAASVPRSSSAMLRTAHWLSSGWCRPGCRASAVKPQRRARPASAASISGVHLSCSNSPQCSSTKPGESTQPAASVICAEAASNPAGAAPTPAMRPSAM